ncbi:MAG: hypothetical protein AB7I50_00670 [Vicinamibacterales bacterium]
MSAPEVPTQAREALVRAADEVHREMVRYCAGIDQWDQMPVVVERWLRVFEQLQEHVFAAPTMLFLLRDMEWLGLNDGRGVTHQQCPACSALKSRGTGHNPYCGLAAAIDKAEGK